MEDRGELLTVAQTAAKIRRCYSVTRDLILRGRIPGEILAGRVYAKADGVRAYVAARVVEAQALEQAQHDRAVPA